MLIGMTGLLTAPTDRTLDIDGEETERILTALSTASARQILSVLEDRPATASELADATDLTPQNVSYHLGKLDDADLVDTAGTRGTGGHEATVYTATRQVVIATENSTDRRYRPNLLALLAALALSFVCLESLVEPSVAVFTTLFRGVGLPPVPF